ncbi:hypothetical protein PRNP1_002150 [Phytophthora ramorum]
MASMGSSKTHTGSLSTVVKAAQGFFIPKAPVADSGLSLFRRFEKAPPSWSAFQQKIDHLGKDPKELKVVYFVRHAQGFHNVARQKYGSERWEELARSDEYLDPDLTPFGVEDTKTKGPPSVQAELERGMPPLERVVVSPLSRAIQTAQTFFAKDQVPNQRFLCMENCREILDCCTFDKRQPVSVITHKFPDVDVSFVKDEEDLQWSPTHYETLEEINARAKLFLSELFDIVPERYVVVVSHVCFIQAVYAVTTGTELPRLDNCDVVPLVLEVV